MSRQTKLQRLRDVHEEALVEFDRIIGAVWGQRMESLQDRRFASIAGAQWEDPLLAARFENKPRFEINKTHRAGQRIINEQRNNRIDVEFISKDGKNAEALADVCAGLRRADQQDSHFEEAVNVAFQEGVYGGFGAYRLRPTYENENDPEDDRQRIRYEVIVDADKSVFFDLSSKLQDKSDARKCYVITDLTPQAYEEEWGDDISTWPESVSQRMFDWCAPEYVRVAEYYVVEDKKETYQVWRNATGEETLYGPEDLEPDDDDPEALTPEERLEATGNVFVRERRIVRRRVHKYILSGERVLKDEGFIAGENIPIIPVYGIRTYIDGIERFMGRTRLAKDPQRLLNMQESRLAEIAAYSTISKPIVTPEQIAGHEKYWAEDNIKQYAYLVLNALRDTSGNIVTTAPTAYTKPPEIPQALAALIQQNNQDLMDIFGDRAQTERVASNISAEAIQLVQTAMDMDAYIYVDNLAQAIRRDGQVWLSMARDIYTEKGRVMKTVGPQNQVDTAQLLRPNADDSYGVENDLSRAQFDVTVEVGPSTKSRKDAIMKTMLQLLAIPGLTPDDMQVLTATALMNVEGEGTADLREYARKSLVRKGVVNPSDEEAKEMAMAQTQPDPQQELLKAAAAQAAAEAEKAQAEAIKSRAQVLQIVADNEKTHAETLKILNDIDLDNKDGSMEQLKLIEGMLNRPVEVPAVQ